MSELRPLRGGCQCGRNRYIITVPQEGLSQARVLFNTEPEHQIPLATPLAAYIRVPLEWYHSTTQAFFPDETHATIRRVYTHPSQQYSKRNFCGYCGTPLSYWSENPETEADYIHLTLGSLLRDDLHDLEDLGLIPEDEDQRERKEVVSEQDQQHVTTAGPTRSSVLRQSYGVPWFDGMVEGTRIGNMRRSERVKRSSDGRVKVDWEIFEYTGPEEPSEGDVVMSLATTSTSSKRKRESTDAAETAAETATAASGAAPE
ncbi:hypothetical protein N3K66_003699 [Trichothecium roseum]|uniref:Uncharacterized protein n=1 Tax=Trichothecium roseum TaxID=47278 RepID=A0ACC0V8S7_9HYPO|nr:hypothetical protein N3K66_003699 [Trichothecium roseum]